MAGSEARGREPDVEFRGGHGGIAVRELTPGDPAVVGDYRLLARLGAGGMGRVFLGRSAGGRLVAVKLVHPGLAEEPDFRRRFAREVAAAQRVGGRWTAPVLDADTASPRPWVATGFVPGPTLREVVDALHGPLPPRTLWPLVWGLSEALRGIHASGVIHRDLKPSNVMVTLDGPKVIDFGVAKAADASVATRTGAVVGSPGFMAPEQARAGELTPAADLFGLGAVLVHAATGTAPFSGGEVPAHVVLYRVLHEEPELGAMEGPLRELAARCLARDPAARPTVDEVSRLAAAHTDTAPASGSWLPGGLAARLGREAARLLELGSRVPAARPTPPPFPPGPPPSPTSPPPAAPVPPAARRGRRAALVATAVVVAAGLAAVAVTLRTGDGDEPSAGGSSASSPGLPDEGGDAAGGELSLHDRLPADIREAGRIDVATSGARPPLSYPQDETNGVDRELAAELGELLGVELAFQYVDFQQIASAVKSGQVDLAFDQADTEVTRSYGVDVVGYYQAGNVLLVNDSSANTAGLPGMCGGTVTTWPVDVLIESIENAVDDCGTGIRVEPVPDEAAMIEAVRNGDADGALLNQVSAVHVTSEGESAEDLRAVGEPVDVLPYGVAVDSDERELRDIVQEALQTLMDEGRYGEILERHGLSECALGEATVNVAG
ncbi:Serine/threonine protein kinase [Streptomyces zhaozhouensis]|uniref:Serine/threonine protein kinase n=1 Tax=Streptomyces zhaozhouensis TaxID=1300267 RepID=A0A286DRA0_9ACTN|nr:transporter substrate-binding domain-containing protein [Streptomyces zhaozhouensis]SOD61161.1 Serine/threonine protein kinase [Streptomyces zhaozhouensis]